MGGNGLYWYQITSSACIYGLGEDRKEVEVMINGDLYTHYGNKKEYFFDAIALPIAEFWGKRTELEDIGVALDARTPKGEPIQEIKLFYYKGVKFVEDKVPMAIYQSEDDYNTDKVWVRDVSEFFGYVKENGKLVKRFEKMA